MCILCVDHTSLALWRETDSFRAFGRRFYPKRLTKSTFVEGEAAIYHCGT